MPDLYADIVLPLPMEHPYTYRVPVRFHGRVAVGMRAVVPVMNRYETGFIVALKHSTNVERVKELVDLPGEGPDFDTGMLSLCRWLAGYITAVLGARRCSARYRRGCGRGGNCGISWPRARFPRGDSPKRSGRWWRCCIARGR